MITIDISCEIYKVSGFQKGKAGFASIKIVEITTVQRAAGTYLAPGMFKNGMITSSVRFKNLVITTYYKFLNK